MAKQKKAGSFRNRGAFDEAFITPMSEQKLGKEPGPDVFSIPVLSPNDPLGVVPGGGKKGSITKGK